MKALYKYLSESLLDDLDDLIDTSDKKVKRIEVNNPDFISMYGGGWEVIGDTAVLNNSNYTGRRTRRSYIEYPHIRIGQKSIDEWLGTNEVRVDGTGLYLEGSIISKDTFSKKLIMDDKYTHSLHIFGNHLTIKDINIEMKGSLMLASDDQILISNSNMNVSNNLMEVRIRSHKIPEFNKFKSNAHRLSIADTFIFDGFGDKDAVSQIDKHLALPYTIKVRDDKKNEDVDIKIKSFKKIHAIINNRKRYTPLEPVLQFKPGFKITDLIDISGCKNLMNLTIFNNLVELSFVKRELPQQNPQQKSGNSINYIRVGNWVASIYKK